MQKILTLILSIVFSVNLHACGSGRATVDFANKGGLAGALVTEGYETPEYLGIKMVAIFLVEDIDPVDFGNIGLTEMIYLNPQCGESISECDVAAGDGISNIVSDYFEFTQPTADVNAAINAQQRDIATAIYKYVRIQWCATRDPVDTMRYRTASMPADHYEEFYWGGCNTAVAIPGDLEVNAGDAITVTLEYDLSNLVYTSNNPDRCNTGYATCYTDGVSAWEVNQLDFHPTVRKE